MNATIVVVLQGGPNLALRCLTSIAGLAQDPAHEVVIVDDGSVGLDPLLARLGGDLEIVRLGRRAGWAAAAKAGIDRTKTDAVILLKDLPELSPGCLGPLLDALALPGRAGATAVPPAGATPSVAANVVAARREHLADLALPVVADDLAMAALIVELSAHGRVEPEPASIAAPPASHSGGARGALGQPTELSIIVPTLDVTSARVRATLAAAQATVEVPHELIVIDNGAPPQGFSAPVNAGLRAARGDYLVVMNDDVELLPGWWEPLRDALDAGASVAFPMTIDGAMRTDFAAWCFAMPRTTLDEFSVESGEFFDPTMRVWFQDTDLLHRLRLAGRAPMLVEASQIRHGLSETVATTDPELRAWIDTQIRQDQATFKARWGDNVAGAAR